VQPDGQPRPLVDRQDRSLGHQINPAALGIHHLARIKRQADSVGGLQQVGRPAIGGEGVKGPKRESYALARRDQPLRAAVRKRDRAVIFLEQDAREGKGPAHVLAQWLTTRGREELVGILGFGVADQLVEEFGADEGMRRGHGLAQQVVFNGAQRGADLALNIGAGRDADPDQRAAGIIRICMLTGARVGEVRQARFEQFNLELGIWSKPAAVTKQRKIHRVPISEDVAAIVRQRHLLVPKGNPWLFPGDVPGQPVKEIRRFWMRVQKAAGIEDARIHDLRHTFASLLVSGGASLEMIGKLLGHTQMQTTLRYAHLYDAPLRAGLDAVASAVRPRLKVVEGPGTNRKSA